MTIRVFLLSSCIVAMGFVNGCASEPKVDPFPPPEITQAVFKVGSLDTCFIDGAYFKLSSTSKSDVIVSLNGRNWRPADKILESSGTSYVAQLPYGPDYPEVYVRVYGMNGTYSESFIVYVARRGAAH